LRTIGLRFLALSLSAFAVSGCNLPISYSTQDLTGDWTMAIVPPVPTPIPIGSLAGALAGKGQNITGTFRAPATTCMSPTFDINFTGNQTADGKLTLTSTNLPNNTATITGTINATYGYNQFNGNMVISGDGSCATTKTAFIGAEVPNISGTYSGSITSTSAGTAAVTATLTEAAANTDGQFPLTGTVNVAGATCANTFSATGLVSGETITATLTSTSGPGATINVYSTANPIAGTPLPLYVQIVSGCNGGPYTGSITKQ
jgi:hypothetical protein